MTHRGAARAVATASVATALVALIGTGCSPAPAAAGNSGETAVDTGDQTGPSGPAPGPAELRELLQLRREAARCMRENGVEDFPDPDADGHILYYGDDPDMESTSEKCDELLDASRGRG
jgi:hypothetical protein